MQKTRSNLTIDSEPIDFIKKHAETRHTTVSEVFTQFALKLKQFLSCSSAVRSVEKRVMIPNSGHQKELLTDRALRHDILMSSAHSLSARPNIPLPLSYGQTIHRQAPGNHGQSPHQPGVCADSGAVGGVITTDQNDGLSFIHTQAFR